MDLKRQFEIEIFKLSNKKHAYEFEIDSKFFDMFEGNFINKGNLKTYLELEKTPTMLLADFKIEGSLELTCDRSLDSFDHEVNIISNLIFKYGEEYEEISDEIVIIPADTQKLDISQYIYEFIGLSIPMKKLHPRFCDEDIDSDVGSMVFSTEKDESKVSKPEETEESNDIWAKLKNLKNKNN